MVITFQLSAHRLQFRRTFQTPAARACPDAHIVEAELPPIVERLDVLESSVGDLARLHAPLARRLGHAQYLWRKA